MLGSSGPTEAKVKAATGGSAVGVALAGLLLWLLDTYVFRADPVPDPIAVAVWTLLPIGLTFVGGFCARHTPRADSDVRASEVTRKADESVREESRRRYRLGR
jgi:hypothetical protein